MRAMMALPGFSSDVLMAPEEGGEPTGAGGGDGGAPQPGGSEGNPAPDGGNGEGNDGDEGLPPEGSLITQPKDGEKQGEPAQNPANGDDGKPKQGEPDGKNGQELTEEAWLGKIAFTEELGKTEKGEPIAPNVEALKPFAPVMRELGLNPEQASKLVTAYAKFEMAQGKAAQEAAEKAEAEAQKTLLAKRDELKAQAQKSLSEEDLAYANRAMASLGKEDPVFYKMVQTSLLGVHPCFLKLCAMAGRRTADDSIPHPGGVGGGAQKSPGQILFGEAIKNGFVNG